MQYISWNQTFNTINDLGKQDSSASFWPWQCEINPLDFHDGRKVLHLHMNAVARPC